MYFGHTASCFCARTLLTALLFALVATAPTQAVTINWGDVSDPSGTVVFGQVTEDNGEAQTHFAPQATGPTAVGNRLMLSPQGFLSESTDGVDHLDSTLRTTIAANQGASITDVLIEEFGDYTLGGLAGGEATASVGAEFFWRVLEVNNQAVALPIQMADLVVSGGGSYSRPGDDGVAIGWTGSALLEVQAYLDSLAIDGAATLVELTFDNTLLTAADELSTAFIKKKGVDITVNAPMPEPTTATLLVTGLIMGCRRRRA